MPDVHALIELCRNRNPRRLFIQTHNFPDPDAIGAAYGLQRLLAHFGLDAAICYDGSIDKLSTSRMVELFGIKMSSSEALLGEQREEDDIILVDCQKNSGNTTDFIGDEIAAIDHHPTYTSVAYLYSDIRTVGACCTIIADCYRQLGLVPEKSAATALLYGIKMDTLQFTRDVTEADIEAFAFLFPHTDSLAMAMLERNKIEFQDLKAYGAAIENIRLYGYTGFSRIPFACPDAMIAILSDFILSLIEVEVAVVYCRRKDGLKISVRSERDDVHAGELTHAALAGYGSGGGHAAMAGGLIPAERLDALGNYPDDFLRDLFLKLLPGNENQRL